MTIYAFSTPFYNGYLKVGYTSRSAKERIRDIMSTFPKVENEEPYKIELEIEAPFLDSDVHRELERVGIKRVAQEWFECTKEDVLNAVLTLVGVPYIKSGINKEELIANIVESKRILEDLGGPEQEENIRLLTRTGALEKLEELSLKVGGIEKLKELYSYSLIVNRDLGVRLNDIVSIENRIKGIKEELYNLGISSCADLGSIEASLKRIKKLNREGWDLTLSVEELEDKITSFKKACKEGDCKYKELKAFLDIKKYLEQENINVVTFFKNSPICSYFADYPYNSPTQYIRDLMEYNFHKEKVEQYKEQIAETKVLMKELKLESLEDIGNTLRKLKAEKEAFLLPIVREFLELQEDSSLPEENELQILLSSAETFSIPYGKHKGDTLLSVRRKDKAYYDWSKSYSAQVLLNSLVLDKGIKKGLIRAKESTKVNISVSKNSHNIPIY